MPPARVDFFWAVVRVKRDGVKQIVVIVIQKRPDSIMEHATTRNTCEMCKNLETASESLLW
jgi:hypothetical protein